MGWQRLNLGWSLFSRFHSIWETEAEGSFKVLKCSNQITINQTFDENMSKGTLPVLTLLAGLGNILKRKIKALQSYFPNFTGIHLS